MTENNGVKISRVRVGDQTRRAVGARSLVADRVPLDGFVIQGDSSHCLPLYVTDRDIEKARAARKSSLNPVSIQAESWSGK